MVCFLGVLNMWCLVLLEQVPDVLCDNDSFPVRTTLTFRVMTSSYQHVLFFRLATAAQANGDDQLEGADVVVTIPQ